MTDEQPEYDHIILDLGGDDMITLSGSQATPAEVARAVERVRAQRAVHMQDATVWQRDLLQRWMHAQETVYAVRMVDVPDHGPLTIYLMAACLSHALDSEVSLGANLDVLDHITIMATAGMIQGLFSSVLEPDGEPGSCHVADLTREITENEYLSALQAGWPR